MKSLIVLALTVLSPYAFAGNNSCNFTLPPGRTEVQVLQLGQFVEHTPDTTHTVYSCGPFVNDGTVGITPTTQVVELAQGSCSLSKYQGLNYIIFCK